MIWGVTQRPCFPGFWITRPFCRHSRCGIWIGSCLNIHSIISICMWLCMLVGIYIYTHCTALFHLPKSLLWGYLMSKSLVACLKHPVASNHSPVLFFIRLFLYQVGRYFKHMRLLGRTGNPKYYWCSSFYLRAPTQFLFFGFEFQSLDRFWNQSNKSWKKYQTWKPN